MRLAIGLDCAGFKLNNALAEERDRSGHQVVDRGAHDAKPSDYPEPADAVGLAVLEAPAGRGTVTCGKTNYSQNASSKRRSPSRPLRPLERSTRSTRPCSCRTPGASKASLNY